MKRISFLYFALVALQAAAQLQPVAYADGKQKLNGFSVTPAKIRDSRPGILILPAWKGIDNHAKDSAQKLAAMGYTVFIADIYGEGNYPANTDEAGKQSGYYKKNYKDYQRRISLALEQLIKSGANAGNIAVIGYCFGGAGALETVRSGMKVRGIVTFHGALGKDPSRPNTPIDAKVLACHGADDPFVPAAEVAAFQKEMNDGHADWQMTFYSGAVHSFTDPEAGNDNSKGAAYNEKADKRSWLQMSDFLKEILK